MSTCQWIWRNLVHYWRVHLAVGLAVVVATAVLTGALVMGDSVTATLKYALESRLGQTAWVVTAQERFFTDDLSNYLADDLQVKVAPVLQMRGIVANGAGTVRVNQVQILGVDEDFFLLSPGKTSPDGFSGEPAAYVNRPLAERLAIVDMKDAEVVLRIDKPGALSRDWVLSPESDNTVGVRLPLTGVLSDDQMGRFSLAANQNSPLTVLVPLQWLQKQLGRDKQANLLLVSEMATQLDEEGIETALRRAWTLADVEATLTPFDKDQGLELRSARVFLDKALGQAAGQVHPEAVSLLTYFVNGLRVADLATPYSMVTAIERKGIYADLLPATMTDDQIVITQWLAEDLNAKLGDRLELTYFVPNATRQLEEATRAFRICAILPTMGEVVDASLMPDFPGLKDAESCNDWDPGLPVDLDRIRDKDEAYWDVYRGTPKAFVTLAAGQAMWANRYGDLTAVRFPVSSASEATVWGSLRTHVDPMELGMVATAVRAAGDRARTQGTDFGQLFLGLSMFLIAAAIMLIGLLFVFEIQSRATQTGMLLAVGFPMGRIRGLYLLEGVVVAFAGAVIGTRVGLFYTQAMIWGLATAWQGAVGGTAIRFAATISSQITGGGAGFVVALGAMVWTLRKQMRAGVHTLLTGEQEEAVYVQRRSKRRIVGWTVSLLALLGALILIVAGGSAGSGAMAGMFFGAGTLLLISMLTGIGQFLRLWATQRCTGLSSMPVLATRQVVRRAGRSLAVIAMLACGVFMVVAVGANRKNPAIGAEERGSGTGGFALYGETAVPLLRDLNETQARKALGLEETLLQDVSFVAMRVRAGDDASCLNLNRAQQPRLLGVHVCDMAERGAFRFQQAIEAEQSGWDLLDLDLGPEVVPVIGDFPTVYWGLGKKLGDELIYRNQAGRDIYLRIVGLLTGSILQGQLLISEEAFMNHYPSVEGYRAVLIDAPAAKTEALAAHLTDRLTDLGLSLETTVHRLATFGQVENTYLSMFLVLGALGLVLGCVGLGLIVVRNLLEREGELAMLRAVGFSRRSLIKMVCWEHAALVAVGLVVGTGCALLAVGPALKMAAGRLPVGLLAFMLLLIAGSGLLWVWLAARWVLQGAILEPLRKE